MENSNLNQIIDSVKGFETNDKEAILFVSAVETSETEERKNIALNFVVMGKKSLLVKSLAKSLQEDERALNLFKEAIEIAEGKNNPLDTLLKFASVMAELEELKEKLSEAIDEKESNSKGE